MVNTNTIVAHTKRKGSPLLKSRLLKTDIKDIAVIFGMDYVRVYNIINGKFFGNKEVVDCAERLANFYDSVNIYDCRKTILNSYANIDQD